MRYVLDASAALCWVLPRPSSGMALQLRADFQNAVHELIAPSVFSGEVASALTKAERLKLIRVGDARPLLGRVFRHAAPRPGFPGPTRARLERRPRREPALAERIGILSPQVTATKPGWRPRSASAAGATRNVRCS